MTVGSSFSTGTELICAVLAVTLGRIGQFRGPTAYPATNPAADSRLSASEGRIPPSRQVSGLRPPTANLAADSRLSASEGPNPTLSRQVSGLRPETGGEGGIRTHGSLSTTTAFEAGRFNHSRTSPRFFWLVGTADHTVPGLPDHRPTQVESAAP